jgi:hypothetical protein
MSAPVRYVVLHHTGHGEPHFDLMIEAEAGGALMTWRLPTWPVDRPMPVERLADHRRAYLDYEGPVSRGRGEVRRVAAGTVTLAARPNETDVLELTFNNAPRLLLLSPPTHAWSLRPAG